MTDQLQIQPVKLDKDVLNPVSASKLSTGDRDSDSHEFNKILSKQSDKNKPATNAERQHETHHREEAHHANKPERKQDAAAAKDSAQAASHNGKDLPAKLPADAARDASQDIADEVIAAPAQLDTTADQADELLAAAIATPTEPQSDSDTTESDAQQAVLAGPQTIDVLQQAQEVTPQQASDTRKANIAVETLAAANAINQSQSVVQDQSADSATEKVALTPVGIQKAIENQPGLPAQANAELRSVVKVDPAITDLPAAKISFRSPDADTLPQWPLFDKLANNPLQAIQSKTTFHESLLNFTTRTERIDLNQATANSATGADKVLHNAAPLPGSDHAPTSSVNQVRPALELPVQHPQWGQELGNKAVWMINHRLSEAQIRLNPKELGPIEIKVNVQNDQATVHFNTHHHGVRESIETAIPRLRDLLAEQGLNLVDVNVAQQDAGHAQSEGFGQAFQGSASGDANIVAAPEETVPQVVYTTDLSLGNDRIDYYA